MQLCVITIFDRDIPLVLFFFLILRLLLQWGCLFSFKLAHGTFLCTATAVVQESIFNALEMMKWSDSSGGE